LQPAVRCFLPMCRPACGRTCQRCVAISHSTLPAARLPHCQATAAYLVQPLAVAVEMFIILYKGCKVVRMCLHSPRALVLVRLHRMVHIVYPPSIHQGSDSMMIQGTQLLHPIAPAHSRPRRALAGCSQRRCQTADLQAHGTDSSLSASALQIINKFTLNRI
jgi:hypothetical protein